MRLVACANYYTSSADTASTAAVSAFYSSLLIYLPLNTLTTDLVINLGRTD